MPNVSPVDYDPFDAGALISALPNPGIAPPNPWITDPAKAEIAAANASALNWQTLPTDDWERQQALVRQEPMGIGKIADALVGTAQAPARGIAAGVGNMLNLPNTPEFQSWAGLAVPQTQDDATRTMLGQYVAGQGLNTAANVAVPSMAADRPAGSIGMGGKITAYHGTPHDFDQFDIGKIGTGEGAQVYGHGLYFAEHPEVARGYADNLAPTTVELPSGERLERNRANSYDTDNAVLDFLRESNGDFDAAITAAQKQGEQLRRRGDEAAIVERLADLKARGAKVNKGHLYQVEINADPSHFLDWDKPLSEQSPEVQGKFGTAAKAYFDQVQAQKIDQHRQMGANSPWASEADATAGFKPPDTVEKFQNQAGAPKAAALLRAAGIPGIRYLDQGSRGAVDVNNLRGTVGMWQTAVRKAPNDAYAQKMLADSQAALDAAQKPLTSNYVLFNDKLVNITHKNGVKVTPVEHDPFKDEYSSGGVVQLSDYTGKLTPVDFDPFAEGIAA